MFASALRQWVTWQCLPAYREWLDRFFDRFATRSKSAAVWKHLSSPHWLSHCWLLLVQFLCRFLPGSETSLMGFALPGVLNSSIWNCLVWCTFPPFQDSQVHRVRIARSNATWRNQVYGSTDKESRKIVFHLNLFVAHLASKHFHNASMQLEGDVFDIRLEHIWDPLSRDTNTDSLISTTCMWRECKAVCAVSAD